MTELIIILLKTLIVVGTIFIIYNIWKVIQSKKWEGLLEDAQKSKQILLKRSNYKKNYISITLLVVLLLFSINNPRNIVEVFDQYNAYMDADGVIVEQKAYIIEVDEVDVEYYSILTNAASDQVADIYEANAVVAEDLSNTVDSLEGLSLNVMYSAQVEPMITSILNIDSKDLKAGSTYLVIGNYIEQDSEYSFMDHTVNDGGYFYTVMLIELIGYDPSKSLTEQSEEIQRLIEDNVN
jgi:hypothetical protein